MYASRLRRWARDLATGFAGLAAIGGVAVLIGTCQFLAAIVISAFQPGWLIGLVMLVIYTIISMYVMLFTVKPLSRRLGFRLGFCLALASQLHLYALAIDTANNTGPALLQVIQAPVSWFRLLEMLFGDGLVWPPVYAPAFAISAVFVLIAGHFSDA